MTVAEGTKKAFRGGTERAVPPAETLDRILPLLPEFGITRIANVTGLDRVGLPVIAVSRPNSRSISVSQGKGLTLEAAQVSGLMESIESWHAEHALLPLLLGSEAELSRTHRLIETASLPRQNVSRYHRDARVLWTMGVDLGRGEQALLPYELVHTDFRLPLPSGGGAFLMSSNGLASGNRVPEALSHALCELVERDANTLFHLRGPEQQAARRLDLRTVSDAACAAALARFNDAELEVGVWETTSDVGICSFLAQLVDRDSGSLRPMPPISGSGCHLRRHIALARALTEAAQGRLTLISGSRDDLSARAFDEQAAREESKEARDSLTRWPACLSFEDVPDRDHATFEEDVAFEIECLARAGLPQVVTVNLTQPKYDIAVVRAVVPGLEAMSEAAGYVFGRRAQAIMAQRVSA